MADHLTLSNSRGATRRPSSVFNEAGVGVLSRSPFLFFGFSVIDPARMGKKRDRKSTRLNSSHSQISYAVFCLKKKKKEHPKPHWNTTPIRSHAAPDQRRC